MLIDNSFIFQVVGSKLISTYTSHRYVIYYTTLTVGNYVFTIRLVYRHPNYNLIHRIKQTRKLLTTCTTIMRTVYLKTNKSQYLQFIENQI